MTPNRNNAERAAKIYLEMRGYKILELNWGLSRNRIDVIAEKNEKVSFIEVNQRDDTTELPILTKSKADKLKMAGEAWADQNKYSGDYTYCSVELSKPDSAVIGFNEDILI